MTDLWNETFKKFVLAGAIRYHMHLYYSGKPEISDNSFDVIYRELQRLEKKTGHTAYDSPTKSPGGMIPDDTKTEEK